MWGIAPGSEVDVKKSSIEGKKPFFSFAQCSTATLELRPPAAMFSSEIGAMFSAKEKCFIKRQNQNSS